MRESFVCSVTGPDPTGPLRLSTRLEVPPPVCPPTSRTGPSVRPRERVDLRSPRSYSDSGTHYLPWYVRPDIPVPSVQSPSPLTLGSRWRDGVSDPRDWTPCCRGRPPTRRHRPSKRTKTLPVVFFCFSVSVPGSLFLPSTPVLCLCLVHIPVPSASL